MSAAIGAAMLPPPTLSPGALILKKMGWKVGQGIGPRLTYHQRKLQDLELGLPTPAEEDEEEASKHTYAPRDTGIVVAERKDNSHGLGYRPGMGLNESLGVKGAGKAGPKLAGGFQLSCDALP
jgi:G patch domain-containing protein 1